MADHHDPFTDRLSEHIDGLLPELEAVELEEHMAECAGCREIADGLVRIRDAARTLENASPARDLWPRIRRAMDGSRVIDMGERAGTGRSRSAVPAAPPQGRRRPQGHRPPGLFLSLPQMTGIAAAFVVVTAWGIWQAAKSPAVPAPDSGAVAAASGEGPHREPVRLAADRDPAVADDADEVDRLQRLLVERRGTLDPETVDVLEKNLAIIDRAIRESLAALEVDPGNPFVEEHLRLSVDRKVDYLRRATSLPDRAS